MQQSLSVHRGSVLIFALLVLAILLAAALSVAGAALTEKRSAFATQQSVLAFQAADSAAERVLQRVYKIDSPLIASIPIDEDVGDDNLDDFATHLGRTTSPACSNGKVTGTNDNPSPAYTFAVTFLDKDGKTIACDVREWRDKVISIRSEGFFRNTSRVVEIGIRPRE